MAKTKTQLATRALSILGKVQAGQSPASEDLTLVEGLVDDLCDQLARDDVIYIGDTGSIEESVFLPLAARLALEAAPDFGLPAVDDDTKRNADRPLRRLASRRPSYKALKATYY